MENNKPIFWHQGLFLQPQHFQLSDLYYRALLAPLNNYAQPHFWGIIRLKIDQGALINRSLSIEEGEFLFPDGTHAVYPGNTVIKSRSLEAIAPNLGRPLKVYLGVRKMDQVAGNVTMVPNLRDIANVTTRYVTTVDPEEVKDFYQEGPTAQVKVLQLASKIFFETEKDELADYWLIPIAQIQIQGDKISISPTYIPPSVTIEAPDMLMKIIKDITDKVGGRCRILEEYKVPGEMRSTNFDIGQSFFLLALHTLNRYMPMLMHLVETRNVHPWAVYGLLAELTGELSTFSKEVNTTRESKNGVRTIPAYNHLDLYTCFSTLQALISQLLDEITVGPESVIRLTYLKSYYTGAISSGLLTDKNNFYLIITTDSDLNFVSDSIQRLAKMSAVENLPTLISRAIPGIGLKYSQFPPSGMRHKANSLCFRIDDTSPQWADVKRYQNIGLYWDKAPQDIVAEVLIVRRY